LDSESSRYDETLSSPMAEERPSAFDMPPMELDDAVIEGREATPEFAEGPSDDDFGDDDLNDIQETAPEAGVAESAVPSRRRRRRRGRRGVHREDAFLGIERLATEDIVGRPPASTEARMEDSVEEREENLLGEEIGSIEIGGHDDDDEGEAPPASESDVQRKRRRRRRRGRGSKERFADKGPADVSTEDADDDTEAFGHDRDQMPDARVMRQRDKTDADDDDLDEPDESGRPSKNLHREVTPWAEAIGFIVSTNMEARARSPGRGGKNERRN
jgi:hypothetical protein